MNLQVITESRGQVAIAAPNLTPRRLARVNAIGSAGALTFTPTALELDGTSCGERFMARVDGALAPLTAKSFKYLLKLVVARLMSADGWVYKDEIEIGFNQARYLYRMRGELESGLGGVRWPVYENNRLGYYRIALEPAAISVNIESLVENPDFEIAECAQALRAWRRKSA